MTDIGHNLAYARKLTITGFPVYGSSRLGEKQANKLVYNTSFTISGVDGEGTLLPDSVILSETELINEEPATQRKLGKKLYELTNHLGNVLATIFDRRVHTVVSSDTLWDADIASAQDYYCFGMIMPDRNYVADGGKYRYGFQGQEHDDELKGARNSLNFKYRMHDPRLGRFFAVDPLAQKYSYYSPYAFSENRLLDALELEGLEAVIATYHTMGGGISHTVTKVKTKEEIINVQQNIGAIFTRAGVITSNTFSDNSIESVVKRMTNRLSENGNMRTEPEGSEKNAFRHAFLQTSLSHKFGNNIATTFGNAHEGYDYNWSLKVDFTKPLQPGTEDLVVDVLNNEIGRNVSETLGNNATSIEIARAVLREQHENGLWTTIKDNEGAVTGIEKTKISDEHYKEALDRLNNLDENGRNK